MPKAKKPPGKPKRPKKETLRPSSRPADPPGGSGPNVLLLPQRQAGVRVTEFTALSLGAVWGCVRVISEDLAKLPWGVFRKTPSGKRLAVPENNLQWILESQANPETPAFEFRETIIAHALTWGNGYAEIERDGAGRPYWLWQITPDRVEVDRDSRGNIVYCVKNPRQLDTVLPAEDVFHLRGPGFDGLVGYSVIRLAGRSIGLGIALEESAANFSQNDSTPGGVLEHPARLTKIASDNLRDSWTRAHGGPFKRRTVAVLEEGMKWNQTGLPPEDSQLIQQRQATPSEICRWFRVPPHKIADLMRGTFSNIEHQSIEYVGDALQPWARRLEGEADLKLFGTVNRGPLFTKIDFKDLLRGDSTSQAAFITAMIDRGVYSPNDARTQLDLDPLGPDGDKRFVPLNMQLLDKAGEEPPPPKEAPPLKEPPIKEPPGEGSKTMAVPWLEDAFTRLLRTERRFIDAARKNHATPEAMAVWAADYAGRQGDYLDEVLTPPLRELARSLSAPESAIAPVLVGFAAAYAEGVRARAASDAPPNGEAGEYARRLAAWAAFCFEKKGAENEKAAGDA